MDNLDKKIDEYYKIKSLRDRLNKRVDDLNDSIKKELVQMAAAGADESTVRENIDYANEDYTVCIRLRKKIKKPDQGAIDQLFIDKDLFSVYSIRYVPEDYIEAAYLSGDLNDSDVKQLRKAGYDLALEVDKNV